MLQNHCLLDHWFAKRLFIDYAFITSTVEVGKNFKALLIKADDSLGGRVEGDILSSINESLGENNMQNSDKRLGWLDAIRPDSWNVNLSSYLEAMLHNYK